INGERLAEANAPDAGALEWSSTAVGSNEASPGNPVAFELPGFAGQLRPGTNILAIHGLNFSLNSSDFLIRAGLVDRRVEVELAEDSVFYTMDGSDPRLPGGSVAPGAISYTGPFPLRETTLVSARVRAGDGGWSAKSAAVFHTAMPLRVTEIMYNPAPPPEGSPFQRRELEYIELQNVSAEALDLRGVKFVEGIEFDFTESAVTELGPGEVVVLVEDLEGFASRYDLARILVAGEYSGALNDAGEGVRILGPLDEPVLDFEYSDLWQPETDGEGPSLVIVNAEGDSSMWGQAAGWRLSELELGSPGFDESGLEPRGRQLPGDANQDARVDISDAVALLRHLFGQRPELPPCGDGRLDSPGNIAVLDSNGDEAVDVSDAVWLLGYMYQGGAPPSRGTECLRLPGCPNVCGF
ncbi:MAG: dockerin type I domain-containing protein, partial [Planctomycetota bacterium]|nr:dockerin type I domain-containing protein [Planctomycetota bacterium]